MNVLHLVVQFFKSDAILKIRYQNNKKFMKFDQQVKIKKILQPSLFVLIFPILLRNCAKNPVIPTPKFIPEKP